MKKYNLLFIAFLAICLGCSSDGGNFGPWNNSPNNNPSVDDPGDNYGSYYCVDFDDEDCMPMLYLDGEECWGVVMSYCPSGYYEY